MTLASGVETAVVVVVLLGAAWAIQWTRGVVRRRRAAAPPPVPLPPTMRAVGADLDLVHELTGTWREYVYGSREQPTAVVRAYALPMGQWKVFCLFYERECGPFPVAAGAYVTLPYTKDPTDPGHVVWYYTGHIHDTAQAIIKVSDDAFSATPLELPASIRPPTTKPMLFRPGK